MLKISAKKLMVFVYKQLNPYEVFGKKTANVQLLLAEVFLGLLESIQRKLTTKSSPSNPGLILLKVRVSKLLFVEWYKTLKDFSPNIGKDTKKTYFKNKNVKEYIVTFNHAGPFRFHVNKLLGCLSYK